MSQISQRRSLRHWKWPSITSHPANPWLDWSPTLFRPLTLPTRKSSHTGLCLSAICAPLNCMVDLLPFVWQCSALLVIGVVGELQKTWQCRNCIITPKDPNTTKGLAKAVWCLQSVYHPCNIGIKGTKKFWGPDPKFSSESDRRQTLVGKKGVIYKTAPLNISCTRTVYWFLNLVPCHKYPFWTPCPYI